MTVEEMQESQFQYLANRERGETLISIADYETVCRDCNDLVCHNSAAIGISFLRKHLGHRTWVNTVTAGRDPLQERGW